MAGLNPSEFAFDNQVNWIPGGLGIQFGEYAIVFTEPFVTADQAASLGSSA